MSKPFYAILAVSLSALSCSRGGASPSPGPAGAASTAPGAPAAAASATPDPARPLPDPLPEVVARVNGEAIPLLHTRLMANNMLQGRTGSKEATARAYRQAMEELVSRELLVQEAMARKLSAVDSEVDAEYDRMHAGLKDETAWAAYLGKQGLDVPAFKKELRVRHTVNALLQKVREEVPGPVSDADAKKYYDGNPQLFTSGPRVRASHILILVPADTDAAKKAALRKKAEELLKRAKGGEDFAALARANSEDQGSGARGGELPVFGKGQMVPPFEAAAFALPAGAVSDLVESQFGFHIIKVHEKLPDETASFESTKQRLKEFLLEAKRQEAITTLVNTLRAKAKIETYL